MEKIKCTYCQTLILTCRIKCAECTDFDLCLQCFACGVESGSHKKDHDYSVVDPYQDKVFKTSNQDWDETEEEILLDAVEQYGFGNWEDVASHLKSKSAIQCKEHYQTYYITGNIGQVTFPLDRVVKTTDHTTPEGGPLSPSITTPLSHVDLSLIEQQELGYLPLRDDFEREYDNECETLVSGCAINYDDEDIDIAVKVAQVDMYRHRLQERTRRKTLARQYGIIQQASTLAIKKAQASKKKVSREEKDVTEKLKVFAQFHTPKEHEKMIEDLVKEKHIKQRIKELCKYRKNGITKLEECPRYDSEKIRRDKKRENKKKMGSTASRKPISMVTKKYLNGNGGVDVITIGGYKARTDGAGDQNSNVNKKDPAAVPCSKILSTREKRLCKSIGLRPASYITIKTSIIKDYLQRKQGFPVKIRYPNNLDKTHRRRILSFLSDNGWIGGI